MLLLFLLLLLHLHLLAVPVVSDRTTYIVQMAREEKPDTFSDHIDWYVSLAAGSTKDTILYSYDSAFHGFAARLTADEVGALQASPGVVAVYPETVYHLHTTRSPEFLGLEPLEAGNIWSAAVAEHDVIVGVLDTGIWPESASFTDGGMGPIPSRWKGVCEEGRGFTAHHCNRKVIGARMFFRGYEAASGAIDERIETKSPRDEDGHGTHTAATAAGAVVENANLLGYAAGTARGMAPRARVAAYKVCWAGGCFSSDILSAVDRAVADGVDVLSISLGGGVASYSRDSLSVAAFGAMEKGVFVACSAGNSGPDPVSLTNVAPWITTVGASTMDRDFPSFVRLGNGVNVSGVSLYRGRRRLLVSRQYPLVYLGGNSSSPDPRSLCLEGTLDRRLVAGKIVLCDRGISPRVQKGQVVKEAGGVGMILANAASNGDELVADCHLLPAVTVGATAARVVRQYAAAAAAGGTATLSFGGTKLGIKPSPVVAAFSSRGPNVLSLEILKPDVVAPGVNILAAWSGSASPSSLKYDRRRVGFNIISGTSMSCPHVAGVAALIKAVHPDWSPSAVKSALMTTAYLHDNELRPLRDAATGLPSTYYDHGAGHINPSRAADPGLVYDAGAQDYYDFLCTQKLTSLQLKAFARSSNRTCRGDAFASPGDLNYPAISVVFPERRSTYHVKRVLTNVGSPASTYHVKVSKFHGARVVVEPDVLRFTRKNERLSYGVTFVTKTRMKRPEFGALAWKDGVHSVRSPIVVTWLAAL